MWNGCGFILPMQIKKDWKSNFNRMLDDVSPDEIVKITYPRKIYDPLLSCYYYIK